MAEKFNMADLTTSLLSGAPSPLPRAAGKPSAGQQGGAESALPPVVSEGCQRPARRRPDGAAQAEVSTRQQQRDARAYAEAWWQCIREWETRASGSLLVVGERSRSGSGRQMVPVVGNWSSTPVGTLQYTQVSTPMGWISETALALACNANTTLTKLRGGGGMGSLIHTSGQGWNGKEALGYGVTVLSTAARLGDQTAIHHLDLLKLGKLATVFVELPQE